MGHLNLLVVTDLHAVQQARHSCPIPSRRADLGVELLTRAIHRARRLDPVDALVLLGDLVDNGRAAGAEEDLAAVAHAAAAAGVPVIAVPGNHDGDPERYLRIFEQRGEPLRLGGCCLVPFADAYAPNDEAARSGADLERLRRIHAADPETPIIALQHSPIHPWIEGSYPYNLRNSADVMRAYRECGVLLSLSGHYHSGLDEDGRRETGDGRDGADRAPTHPVPRHPPSVRYVTAPAACEAPFRFLLVTIEDGSVRVREESLAMDPALGLVDVHCHSQFAYCAEDVTAKGAVERARTLGLAKLHLTEHAGQLYLPAADFWPGTFLDDLSVLRRARRERRDRMAAWRAEVDPLRAPDVGIGLEVECGADGSLAVLDEDREGVDILVGAVHWVKELRQPAPDLRAAKRDFMRQCEGLARAGVDVLAHPFRVFQKAKQPCPEELFRPVAELLRAHNVAAEINFHGNHPEPAFFALCHQMGVRIALGSDSHTLREVGEFGPNVRLLREIGTLE